MVGTANFIHEQLGPLTIAFLGLVLLYSQRRRQHLLFLALPALLLIASNLALIFATSGSNVGRA